MQARGAHASRDASLALAPRVRAGLRLRSDARGLWAEDTKRFYTAPRTVSSRPEGRSESARSYLEVFGGQLGAPFSSSGNYSWGCSRG